MLLGRDSDAFLTARRICVVCRVSRGNRWAESKQRVTAAEEKNRRRVRMRSVGARRRRFHYCFECLQVRSSRGRIPCCMRGFH